MFTRQAPAKTILIYAQFMARREMPSEHLAAPAALQANDVIAMDRSPDRDGGCPVHLGFDRRFTEADERLTNGRDQRSELVGRDLVLPNIGGNNHRGEFSIE
jgi:hypothetical protein